MICPCNQAVNLKSTYSRLNTANPHRSYEDRNGCSAAVTFCVKEIEKGDKKIKSTEVLLRLPKTPHIADIIDNYKDMSQGQDGVRARLDEVTTPELRDRFRCCFWGDVCRSMTIALTHAITYRINNYLEITAPVSCRVGRRVISHQSQHQALLPPSCRSHQE